MKGFILVLTLILLELFIFPVYNFRDNHKILSRTTIHFLGILNSVYSTRDTLRKYKLLTVLIISLNYLFGKFLISQFYDSNGKYFDSMHSLIIIFITIIPFIFFTSEKSLEEFEQGGLVKNFIHNGLSNIISVNQLFYFYKHFHLKYGNIIEYNFNKELMVHFIVDFLANSFSYIINNLLCYYFSYQSNLRNKNTIQNKQNGKYLINILKRFILMVLANVAFYSIYSFQMARTVFEVVNYNVPQPHNLILYNLLPKDLDQRFRSFLYIFNWLIFMR